MDTCHPRPSDPEIYRRRDVGKIACMREWMIE